MRIKAYFREAALEIGAVFYIQKPGILNVFYRMLKRSVCAAYRRVTDEGLMQCAVRGKKNDNCYKFKGKNLRVDITVNLHVYFFVR